MKRFIRTLLVLGAALALLGSSAALAAGDTAPAISVQLNGETLTFTDAVPQARDNRTFLPFRAVFEAMGADVSNEGNVITAVRGDRKLTMTIGETRASVTTGGVTLPLTMDVAPYVDTTTWRTYVPVRFAAQALGCAVGWDQEAYTAIIVDTDKLVEKALEGKQFTYLDKYMEYSNRFNEGIWNTDMALTGQMSMTGDGTSLIFPISAQAKGITQDQSKLELDMNLKLDITAMLDQLVSDAQTSGAPAAIEDSEKAMAEALAKEGIDFAIRGDITEGKLAFTVDGAALAQAGLPQNTWYTMDLAGLFQGTGMDYASLLSMAQDQANSTDYVTTLVKSFLSTLTPTSADNEGHGVSYQTFAESVENVVYALSDEGFTKSGSDYTCTIDGGLLKMELTLTMKQDKVVAYAMTMTATQTVGEDNMSMVINMAVDEKDQFTGSMKMDMAGLVDMDLALSGGYTKGTTAPQTQPPEGVGVIDLNALMGAGA